jgi:hypothetical protein
VPCTLRRADRPRAHRDGRLGPGRAAALGEDRLVLLPSGSDTVRGSPLRGTRSSTSHRRAAFEDGDLGRGFSPAGADCRYRAPLVPRLARPRKFTPVRLGSTGSGGEGGIRTRDGLPRTAFPVRRHSPLGDLSAEGIGSSVARLIGMTVTPAVGSGGTTPQLREMAVPGKAASEHRSERTRRCVSEARRRERRQEPSDRGAYVAERAGFEPAVLSHTAFRERHHQPLGHLSAGEDTKPRVGPMSGADPARRLRRLAPRRRGPAPRHDGCR